MSKQHLEYLKHILDETNLMLKNSKDLNRERFVRSLEIIGEAAKKLPVEFREKHSAVDWKVMAMTRDN